MIKSTAFKTKLRHILGFRIWGMMNFYRFPELRDSWGGAFNGQEFRAKIFQELIENIDFGALFETGSFRGTTTEFMAQQYPGNIYTMESQLENHGFCQARFWQNHRIHVLHGDSRTLLPHYLKKVQLWKKPIICYLDAHWLEDLPLLKECQIIQASGVNAVIMIDDFAVPTDSDYQFDDYGENQALTLDYLSPFLKMMPPVVFFPNCPASQETGQKRGCVVLGTTKTLVEQLKMMETLTAYAI